MHLVTKQQLFFENPEIKLPNNEMHERGLKCHTKQSDITHRPVYNVPF